MDGIHDLGGKQGFGPVDVDEEQVAFHADWEGRMWAIAQCAGGRDGWTLDWWRHCRELIDPVDYLARPYFDSWMQAYTATYIDSGTISLDEIIHAKSATPAVAPPPAKNSADVLADVQAQGISFEKPLQQAPRFTVGDNVMTRQLTTTHHTRLPAYARGKPGIIHAHHGAHIFADSSAQGDESAQHIYSVAFAARDLWPEARNSKDRVFLDLWESYLE